MIQGEYPNKQKIEIMYVGESISSSNIHQKIVYAEEKNFAINVISKSGTTTEPAIAFRLFKKLLEDKIGIYNSTKFIFITTDPTKGSLLKIAQENKYKTFTIPSNIGGRFSVLTAVGLFPMACAGLNIEKILEGAKKANEIYKLANIDKNQAYRYAVARIILNKTLNVELMVQYEPQMKAFNE
jgi:glucose-6-phosphate isomerase